jgi:hypothetical protein
MALNKVTTASTILASDINQIINVLQRDAGQNETGKYSMVGSSYANGANFSLYVDSLNRVSVPTGVTIDTADQAPANNCNVPGSSLFTANGFLINTSGNAITLNPKCGGNYTLSY